MEYNQNVTDILNIAEEIKAKIENFVTPVIDGERIINDELTTEDTVKEWEDLSDKVDDIISDTDVLWVYTETNEEDFVDDKE